MRISATLLSVALLSQLKLSSTAVKVSGTFEIMPYFRRWPEVALLRDLLVQYFLVLIEVETTRLLMFIFEGPYCA